MNLLALIPLLLAQELDDPVRVDDHEFSIRPPRGWRRLTVEAPTVLRFAPPESAHSDAILAVRHYEPQNPGPMAEYRKELDRYLAEQHPGHTVLSDREFTHGGFEAFQRRLSCTTKEGKDVVMVKTIIHRGHRNYYLVDTTHPKALDGNYLEWMLKCAESLEIAAKPPTASETEAEQRFLALLRDWKDPVGKFGEQWQSVHLGKTRVGYQMQSLGAGNEIHGFTAESQLDFGDGGSNTIRSNGSFDPGGAQSIDVEETVRPPKKEPLVYRARADMTGGKCTVEREMNGVKEKKEFSVPPGTLFSDVADALRGNLAMRGKAEYAWRILDPFDDEPVFEFVEVSGAERVRWSEEEREIRIVQVTSRRRVTTYWYGADSRLLRVISGRSPFEIRGATREEATGGKK